MLYFYLIITITKLAILPRAFVQISFILAHHANIRLSKNAI